MIFIARWWQWWWCFFFSFFQTWVTKHFNNFIEYSFLKALREWRFISVLFCFVSILTETVAQRCSVKQVFLEISQNSQKIICARPTLAASGLIKKLDANYNLIGFPTCPVSWNLNGQKHCGCTEGGNQLHRRKSYCHPIKIFSW